MPNGDQDSPAFLDDVMELTARSMVNIGRRTVSTAMLVYKIQEVLP